MIFSKNKKYSFNDIIKICNKNGLITVDCLKDENMVSVEKEGGDYLFEFKQIKENVFKLTWIDNINLKFLRQKTKI